jgi:hypothetical protein
MYTRAPYTMTPCDQRPIWINFAIDTFVLGSEASYHNREVKIIFNFDDSVLSRIQHVDMICKRGMDDLKKQMNNFKNILVQRSLLSFTALMDLVLQPQGKTVLERDLWMRRREENFLQKIAKQQKWARWNIEPRIVWKSCYARST